MSRSDDGLDRHRVFLLLAQALTLSQNSLSPLCLLIFQRQAGSCHANALFAELRASHSIQSRIEFAPEHTRRRTARTVQQVAFASATSFAQSRRYGPPQR